MCLTSCATGCTCVLMWHLTGLPCLGSVWAQCGAYTDTPLAITPLFECLGFQHTAASAPNRTPTPLPTLTRQPPNHGGPHHSAKLQASSTQTNACYMKKNLPRNPTEQRTAYSRPHTPLYRGKQASISTPWKPWAIQQTTTAGSLAKPLLAGQQDRKGTPLLGAHGLLVRVPPSLLVLGGGGCRVWVGGGGIGERAGHEGGHKVFGACVCMCQNRVCLCCCERGPQGGYTDVCACVIA